MKREIFPFPAPNGYRWFLTQGLITYNSNSPFYPWYYLDELSVFIANERWPNKKINGTLFAFARRQDNDDIACFLVDSGIVKNIVTIHGWTDDGYDIIGSFENFYEWVKSIIDDIAIIAESTYEESDNVENESEN